MSDNTNRVLTSLRLPKKVLEDFGEFAEANSVSKTHIMETMVVALLEGRLVIKPPAGANAFPAEEIEAGSVPEYPLLIALGPGVLQDA